MTMSVRWFGDRAVLIAVSDADERQALLSHLPVQDPRWQVRSGMQEVLVEVASPERDLLDRVREAVEAIGEAADAPDEAAREIAIEVVYDGHDLGDVADLLATSIEGVVAGHMSQLWRVAMMGFAPGFGYLEPVGPPVLAWSALGRRSSPRPRVPPGSVAVAAGMSAVYPAAMPGGWHLLGSTDQAMFDVSQTDRPAHLAPGDLVRFVSVGAP